MTKPFGRLLLVYYHPVIFDLANTFSKLFDKVEICVVPGLKDNYGEANRVIAEAKAKGFDAYFSPVAVMNIKAKKYDLVGLDGVFDGDKVLMDVCSASKVPFFCINGYPHNTDEPSQNILSFSWYLPEKQYRQRYPSEGHVKQLDWKNLATTGQSEGKNILVYYPEVSVAGAPHPGYFRRPRDSFVSFIHRFEECNQESYEVFKQVNDQVKVENFSSLSRNEVHAKLIDSFGLIHLKHADCPGISVLEAMLLGRVPIVMKSFVLASQNQDLLIDNYSAIICDTVPELIRRAHHLKDAIENVEYPANEGMYLMERSTQQHAYMMTSQHRQEYKLIQFFKRCIK
jgi:hypothetical protein